MSFFIKILTIFSIFILSGNLYVVRADSSVNKIKIRYDKPFLWITAVKANPTILLDQLFNKVGCEMEFLNQQENFQSSEISIKFEKIKFDRAIRNICRTLRLSYSILYDDNNIQKYILVYSGKSNQYGKFIASKDLIQKNVFISQEQKSDGKNENDMFKKSGQRKGVIREKIFAKKMLSNSTPEMPIKNNLGLKNNKPYFPF